MVIMIEYQIHAHLIKNQRESLDEFLRGHKDCAHSSFSQFVESTYKVTPMVSVKRSVCLYMIYFGYGMFFFYIWDGKER